MIRLAHMGDVHQIAALIQNSFDADLRPYMVYAQHGAAAFLAGYIRYSRLSDRLLIVAEDEAGAVGGFAEFRLAAVPAPAHLAYICVHPSMQGRGCAKAMIRHFTAQTGVQNLDLYVFASNLSALALYRTLGFEVLGETGWFTRPVPAAVSGEPIFVSNLPTAVATFDHFGFCELQIAGTTGGEKVGRIGASVLRCASVRTFTHDNLLARLADSFSDVREALLIAPDDPGIGQLVNRSIRMGGTIRIPERH